MIAYGLGILPLIRNLRTAHPRVTQKWYSDNTGLGGTFDGIQWNLDKFIVRGTLWGYLPDTTKSILVVSPWNVPQAEELFCVYGLEIVTGSRYLGGFMGMESAKDWWIDEKVEG